MSVRACTQLDNKEGMKYDMETPDRAHFQECLIEAWDDLSGELLDAGEVGKARQKEIGYIDDKHVWKKITRAEAERKGWKIVRTRWIDTNKGDEKKPDIRSRLVAKEFNDSEIDGLFAATPPLEALRLLVSDAATVVPGHGKKIIMINDVARAFFEAPVKRIVCVELPEEAMTREEIDAGTPLVGLLQMSLYGTRDAAVNFQAEVAKLMTSLGFRQGKYNPCTYWHQKKNLKTMVHGDDFVTSGTREQTEWFKKKLTERFEIKTKIVGAGPDDQSEARVLNRIIRAGPDGWEYEPDQRHAELIVKALCLTNAKPVKTPGEDEKKTEEEENEKLLTKVDAKEYRGVTARANYLGQDRMDIQYAVKELSRGMANPTEGDMKKAKRLGRYLLGKPRVLTKYVWQGPVSSMTAYSDSDWAGCQKTSKSTSGGVLMRGRHFIRSWSVTQKCITLSSGEAELIATVKASTELIGVLQLMQDWGDSLTGDVMVDSAAALGIVKRKGNGRLRHVRVGDMWIQEKSENGELKFNKVPGSLNPADAGTKHLTEEKIQRCLADVGQFIVPGRAKASLEVSS